MLAVNIRPNFHFFARSQPLCQQQCLRRSSLLNLRRSRRYLNGSAGPQVSSSLLAADDDPVPSGEGGQKTASAQWKGTLFKMFESAATTFATLLILGLAGYSYHKYYKFLVLQKIEKAFEPGDPVLDLAALDSGVSDTTLDDNASTRWLRQAEQDRIDKVIRGGDRGHYHLLIGEKGTGKSSMLLKAIQKVKGEGIAMLEAHADLEIFRIRLGKALDYEFHEDYIGSLFSIRGPREGATALLDIERAFNKLEKVAAKRRKTLGKPLVLVINSTHLLRDDHDGQDLLELIQQRAEQWAASGLATIVLNSDDYWVYERLKQYSTRMEVLPVLDLDKKQAIGALKQYRSRFYEQEPPPDILEQVYDMVGGRLTFLARVAKSVNMLQECKDIYDMEKTWFLNNNWILGSGMDDDVMDQQKYASAAMVLAKALVNEEKELERTYDPEKGHILPQLPLHKAREIMTRSDFIKDYDHNNIFTIDAQAMVRADSVPMQNAFREICGHPGFEKHLDATLNRIAAIESLGRTRELVAKDLVSGHYQIKGKSDKGNGISVGMQQTEPFEDH
ncbi:uncharacterized protein KY384_001019 [Bacidia gigantensis]|uniref:uncharacterized protein n=1 Tax=Bacidia gigantensis TaxID=2732470 RepID=UPI001D05000D|nr:uncharacterized protein KY384_001019 [Bacidia gigantensis]KAG8534175.1 hypothetical protein KY384_001019 [Bacidia gigantensis]